MAKNKYADQLLKYIELSPTPYHAVENAVAELKNSGYSELKEKESWKLENGKGYFVTRNGSSVAAFCIPPKQIKQVAFNIIGAHTDSPCLKLKPKAAQSVFDYKQWRIEVYGGALWHSWLDRDLGLAGQLCYSKNGKALTKTVNLNTSNIRIPNVAIHINRTVNEEGLKITPQTELTPIFGLGKSTGEQLKQELFTSLGLSPADAKSVESFDLRLYDNIPPSYGGLKDEFIYAPRLDNLAMSHAALTALLEAKSKSAEKISAIMLFDHEEVGSGSTAGAASNFLNHTLERIISSLGFSREEYFMALAQSFIISADMAHAVHPNYSGKHDPDHAPVLNKGPVIKHNANQRYATSHETAAKILNLAKKSKVPLQEFAGHSNIPCGTTIGPISSSLSGIPTVDLGNPMLSMHSAREMAGSADGELILKLFKQFFNS